MPMFNEESVLPLFVARLRPVADGLGVTYEVVAVDDGSTDGTAIGLQRERRGWEQLRVVRLRANAGHQAAISAGLMRARGDFVVTLDADLQDPPETIAPMLAAAREQGVDVVYGVRSDRSSDSRFKRGTARAFYRTMGRLAGTSAQADAGDFRLMSRATVEAVNALPEYGRVLRFVVPALGFPSETVEYRRAERAAGTSKYPFTKMLRLSVDSLTAFSLAPLRFATLLRWRCWSMPWWPKPRGRSWPGGPRPSSSWPGWARCSCSRSGFSGSTSAGCMPRPRPARRITSRTTRLGRVPQLRRARIQNRPPDPGSPDQRGRAVTINVTPGRDLTGK